MRKYFLSVITVIIIGFTIVGCSPISKLEQSAVVDTVLLDNRGTLGQTFVAHYDGLSGIEIYLEPDEPGDGSLILRLHDGPTKPAEISTGSIPLASVTSPGFHQIPFPSQNNSAQAYYYLEMQIQGSGNFRVGTASGDSYLNGALYRDGEPQDSQMSFNLVYKPSRLALGLIQESLTWIGYLLVASFLFIIPGWALLVYLYSGWGKQDWVSKLALSAGVSLAIYPLLLLWTDVVGLHLGAIYAWAPPLLGIAAILWRYRKSLNLATLKTLQKPRIDWTGGTLFILIGMVFFVRFWVIRTLEGPIGSDSLHHTTAVQLILDNKGLMHSWMPYVGLSTFTYHFGFHAAAAVYAWITKLTALKSVLIAGQILNGSSIIALYPLAKRINSSKWSGIIAVLLAGLLFQMPMYYINWGRYTQLASQIILPALVFLIWDILESKEFRCQPMILVWISFAGLALTHYRVLLFGVIFIPAYAIVNIQDLKTKQFFWKTLWMGIGSLLLFVPWMSSFVTGNLGSMLRYLLSTPPVQTTPVIKALSSLNYMLYLPGWAWISLSLSIGWGLWRRNKGVAILSLWWLLTLLAANPAWLNLPGDGLISHGAVITGFYIPAGILIGVAFSEGIEHFTITKIKYLSPVLLTSIILLGAWGALQRRNEILPGSIDVTRPDLIAMEWIRENTPPDARFLVNATPIFGTESWFVGTDAGWWIPLLAQREATTKQMLYNTETETNSGIQVSLNNLTRLVMDKGLNDPDVLYELENQGITHIYIGHHKNDILGALSSSLLNEKVMKSIYNQDGIWIYQVGMK